MPDTPTPLVYLNPVAAVIGDQPLTELETRALVMTALLGYESCGAAEEIIAESHGLDAAAASHLGLPLSAATSLRAKLSAEFARLGIAPPVAHPAPDPDPAPVPA